MKLVDSQARQPPAKFKDKRLVGVHQDVRLLVPEQWGRVLLHCLPSDKGEMTLPLMFVYCVCTVMHITYYGNALISLEVRLRKTIALPSSSAFGFKAANRQQRRCIY